MQSCRCSMQQHDAYSAWLLQLISSAPETPCCFCTLSSVCKSAQQPDSKNANANEVRVHVSICTEEWTASKAGGRHKQRQVGQDGRRNFPRLQAVQLQELGHMRQCLQLSALQQCHRCWSNLYGKSYLYAQLNGGACMLSAAQCRMKGMKRACRGLPVRSSW